MKDNQMYLVRITYIDMVLSDYFKGLKAVKNIVKTRSSKNNVEKIEYGKANYKGNGQWCNWDKDTVVVAYQKYKKDGK